MPPVSVIVPTYNRRELLQRAVQSVFRQSVPCGEIIVVDDASTDGSREYIDSVLDSHQARRIRWLTQPLNRGPAAARNVGIRHARYDMLAFLDSDDHWSPKKLERQVSQMDRSPEYLISHTREKWLRQGQHLNQKNKHIPRHGDIFEHCLQLCAVGMSTVMMHRRIVDHIGYFDEEMRCCEDYAFWLRVSCRYRFLLIDEQLTIKEGGRSDQISFQYRQGMDRLRIESLERLISSDVLDSRQVELARLEMRKKCLIYGKGCLKHGKVDEGRHYVALAGVFPLEGGV